MRLNKTAFWASGVLIMFLILGIDRGLILLKSKHVIGRTICARNFSSRKGGASKSYQVRFIYEGKEYFFWTSRYSSANTDSDVAIIFDPNDPEDAYENSFGGFWLYGFIWIGIAFIPWSAAALSIVGSNERFVITRKKIGLEKISKEEVFI